MKGKRIWPMILVALALIGILAGCGCTADNAKPNNGTVSNPGSNGTVNTDGDGAVSTGPDSTVNDPAHNDVVADSNDNNMTGNVVDDTIDGAEQVVDNAADMVGDAARGVGRAVKDMTGNGTTARNHGRVAN